MTPAGTPLSRAAKCANTLCPWTTTSTVVLRLAPVVQRGRSAVEAVFCTRCAIDIRDSLLAESGVSLGTAGDGEV